MKQFFLIVSFAFCLGSIAQIPQTTISSPTLNMNTSSLSIFPFSKSRPVCVVLIHGITQSPQVCSTKIANKQFPNRPVNTLRFARHYWSYGFVNGLFNLSQDKIYTFSDGSLAGELNATPETWETKLTRDLVATDHILTGCGIPPASGPTASSGCTGFYTVMMTHRDGSLPLKRQVANTANQIRTFYNSVFGSWAADKQPQLVLLCHSGGGLVARAICSNLNSMGISGDPYVPVENFSSGEKSDMAFIRERTMYIITLSTPHEGSLIATLGASAQQSLAPVSGVLELLFGWNENTSTPDGRPTSPILRELDPNSMMLYNQNQLKPENCKRPDGSLIPVYTLGGRSSAGPFYYADPNKWDNDLSTPDGGITLTRDQIMYEGFTKQGVPISNRKEFESAGLLSAEYLVNMTFLNTTTENYRRLIKAPLNSTAMDIVGLKNISLGLCLGAPGYSPVDLGLGARMFCLRRPWSPTSNNLGVCSGRFTEGTATTLSDGVIDSDGFVNIGSAMGINIGTFTDSYFSNTSGGSWYRRYRSACDYDNHGSATQREEVSNYLMREIINLTSATNLFNTGIPATFAGPKVSTTGTKSVW